VVPRNSRHRHPPEKDQYSSGNALVNQKNNSLVWETA